MNELKALRIEKKLTQSSAAGLLGVSLRSYKSYENEARKEGTFKYRYMVDALSALNPIDEDHGVLALEDIRKRCAPVLERYGAEFCYLFGSYAKGKARPDSDVDLVVSTAVTGLRYYGMIEELRTALRKRVDALGLAQLSGNAELIREVLKDGVRIWG